MPQWNDKGVAWEEMVEANPDPYGSCVVRYIERWADEMEKALAEGEALEGCAERTSHSADTEGITGFMYGCAVNFLANYWKRGEELRRWHNLRTQVGDEGERANESSGTLNPAVLCIGG